MSVTSCSFTGHRAIAPGHYFRLSELLDRALAYLYSEGCREFYNGGALGFDILAAERVLLFRMSHPEVRLNMVLPCKNQAERWSERDVSRYEYVLGAADTVEYIADEYYDGCMRVRNLRLVELCDTVVSYVGRTGGGAYQTLRMAQRSGRRIFNLFSAASGINSDG